jgi:hypothetical protein
MIEGAYQLPPRIHIGNYCTQTFDAMLSLNFLAIGGMYELLL